MTASVRLEARREVNAKFKREGVDQLITTPVNDKAGRAIDARVQAAVDARVQPAIKAAVDAERSHITAQVRAEFAAASAAKSASITVPVPSPIVVSRPERPRNFIENLRDPANAGLQGQPIYPSTFTIASDADTGHRAFADWLASQFAAAGWSGLQPVRHDLANGDEGVALQLPDAMGTIGEKRMLSARTAPVLSALGGSEDNALPLRNAFGPPPGGTYAFVLEVRMNMPNISG